MNIAFIKNCISLAALALMCVGVQAKEPFRGGAVAAYGLQGPVTSVFVGYEIKFDAEGKLVENDKPQILHENGNTVYRYDYGEFCVDHAYDKDGKLVSISGAGYTTFAYDNLGRLKTKCSMEDGDYVKEEYFYGADGQVEKILVTSGCEGGPVTGKEEKVCTVEAVDKFGNWTARTVGGTRESRTITYDKLAGE